MQILEPILFEGVSHVVVAPNTEENEELEMGFAHNEGALIIAARPFYDDRNRVTFVDSNDIIALAVRTTDALAADIRTLVTSPDTIWLSMLHIQGVLDTAVGGEFFTYTEGQWEFLPGGGVVISRNPHVEFRHILASQAPAVQVAFKRVIFEQDELVRFVAQRR